MAKVRCPLMSFSAKGQFGNGAINFQSGNCDTTARHMRNIAPKDPTPKQKKIRDNMQKVVAIWNNLHFLDKEHWNKIKGDPRGYNLMLPYYAPRTGYHLFLRRNLSYLGRGEYCLLSPFSYMTAADQANGYIEESVIF